MINELSIKLLETLDYIQEGTKTDRELKDEVDKLRKEIEGSWEILGKYKIKSSGYYN